MTLAVPLAGDERVGASDAAASPLRRTAWWPLALVGIAGLALATGLAIVDALPVGVVADDAFYVILARALANGEGYRALNVPGHPAGTHFPPGYPALLALVSFVAPPFPASIAVFKALNAVNLLRVSKQGELEGFDLDQHGASAYPEYVISTLTASHAIEGDSVSVPRMTAAAAAVADAK